MFIGRRTAAVVAAAGLTASLAWATPGRTLEVSVTYQGGEVSATNAIYLTVWDTPDMASGALPIATAMVSENGGTASFPNLTVSPVYIAALYDEQGGWDGVSAIPSGTPAGQYATGGSFVPAAVELTEGETVEVTFAFNDVFRMP